MRQVYSHQNKRAECVQHPPEYVRFDDVLNLILRYRDNEVPDLELAVHKLNRHRLATP